jgi:hypothetical protein
MSLGQIRMLDGLVSTHCYSSHLRKPKCRLYNGTALFYSAKQHKFLNMKSSRNYNRDNNSHYFLAGHAYPLCAATGKARFHNGKIRDKLESFKEESFNLQQEFLILRTIMFL